MSGVGQAAVTAGTAVGLVLVAAGLGKLRGDSASVQPFLRALGLRRRSALRAVAVGLPAAEVSVGFWLTSGVALRGAAAAAAALCAGFALVLSLALARGVAEPCRCFGVLDHATSHRLSLARALLLLGGAGVALGAAGGGDAAGAWPARGLGALLALCAVLGFALLGEVAAFRSGVDGELAATTQDMHGRQAR